MGGRFYCLGSVDLDRVFEVDHLPGHDEKLFANAYHEGAGGQGLYVARALAALGAPVTFVSAVGDDAAGQSMVAELNGIAGLRADIALIPGARSGSCVILVDRTGEKAIILAPVSRGIGERLGESLKPQAGDVVTANFYHPGAIQSLFARCRAKGATAILDLEVPGIGSFGWDAAMATVESASVICTNRNTLELWSAAEGLAADSLDVAERFARRLAGTDRRSCVTLGDRGVLAFDGARAFHIPARPVQPVNTTGAGDSFLAGLAFALDRGDDFVAAAGFGIAVASDFLEHGSIDRARLQV